MELLLTCSVNWQWGQVALPFSIRVLRSMGMGVLHSGQGMEAVVAMVFVLKIRGYFECRLQVGGCRL